MDLQKRKRLNLGRWNVNKLVGGIRHLHISKLWRKIGLLLAAVVVLGVVGWLVYDQLTVPVKITKVQFERSLSSRTTDAPVKKEFTVGEPLMLMFEYSSAQPETSARLEIYKGKDRVRSVDLPYLRGDKTAPDSGKRYISIVNGASTKLEAGDYIVKIVVNDKRVVLTEKVTVK